MTVAQLKLDAERARLDAMSAWDECLQCHDDIMEVAKRGATLRRNSRLIKAYLAAVSDFSTLARRHETARQAYEQAAPGFA